MTTYPDLSPYEYTPSADGNVVNVGWLGRESDFQVGPVDESIRLELRKRAENPLNVMRGWHDCELCGIESPIRIPPLEGLHGRISLGTGELWVVGDAGITYVAPTLIVHYVEDHGYVPPASFNAALL
jgi:hypothetical protein